MSPRIEPDERAIDRDSGEYFKGGWTGLWAASRPDVSNVLLERNSCSIDSLAIELVPSSWSMSTETLCGVRQNERISLPKGMSVAWYGGGQQQVSRVKTLGMGGLFVCGSITQPLGANLTLVFEVPGGVILAEAAVRNVVPGEGMGVEFVKMNEESRRLLAQLIQRLLR